MPLTPQQQAEIDKLDKDLQETVTIKKIYKNQEDMIQGLNDERELNKSEFAKGREKFKEIFIELKEVKSEVSEMKVQIADGFKQQKIDLDKHLMDSKDNEITKLNKRFDAREQIKNGIIITLVGGVFLYAIIYLIESLKV